MAEQPAAEGRSLYQRVQEGIEVARGKVEELRDNLRDFDAKQQASSVAETASAYFVGSIDKAQTALADLSTTTRQWAERKTEVPVGALTGAFARVSQALNDVTDQARRYDEKYQLSSTVSAAIADPQQQASVALAAAASCAVNAANAATAQLQGVRIMTAAETGLQRSIPTVEKATLAHDLVVQRVQEFNDAYGVATRLQELDERYAVTQYCTGALGRAQGQAQGLDQRVTGGKLGPAVVSAYEMGLMLVGFVMTKYEEVKKKEDEARVEAPQETA